MEQDWIWGLAGGLLIGLAGALYLLGNGRIMGASGIVGGLIDGSGRSQSGERLAFLAGLIGVPLVMALLSAAPSETFLTDSWPIIVIAGLCVGVGTRIANGCTSGHGVCGMSRLSLRGIIATFVYIGSGVATLAVARHLWGLI